MLYFNANSGMELIILCNMYSSKSGNYGDVIWHQWFSLAIKNHETSLIMYWTLHSNVFLVSQQLTSQCCVQSVVSVSKHTELSALTLALPTARNGPLNVRDVNEYLDFKGNLIHTTALQRQKVIQWQFFIYSCVGLCLFAGQNQILGYKCLT